MTPDQSHNISLETLEILNRYQDYMDNIKEVCVMGCGNGLDAYWWANCIREMSGKPRNIKVNAIDKKIDMGRVKHHQNIHYLTSDFTLTDLPENSQNLIYAHNSFQYSLSPIHTLMHWHSLLKVDGMLIISIPYNFYIHDNNSMQTPGQTYYNSCYFNYGLGNLIMLLVSMGFDCRHGHFKIDKERGWIHAAVYKLNIAPNPTVDWYTLCDQHLLPLSIENAVIKNGTFKEADIVVQWLDRSQYILSV